ncbi:alkyl/aryl-sulfatase [Pseudomonas akapageensis]|uniref:alkyl/aryl-sulfatase n=1 Tax=Pseudomonas akapageensis TaxID=2609961 RepID=UPI00140CFD70|nr:alkyl sulfatase dimerization domain-containing protein [Pseudomonas akapageensis]
MKKTIPVLLLPALLASAISQSVLAQVEPKPAQPATIAANAAFARTLPTLDAESEADINRGFIASIPDAETLTADGKVIYSLKGYEFLKPATGPATVNPSLWLQARKSMANGLYKVTEGFYQVRGMDLTNMTIIEGKTGLIIIDPLMTTETARTALDLYYQHRPKKPVLAVIYNHSHVDHYGGVKGIVDEADVKAGKVQIIAPVGFMEHTISENVMAGNAMSRRSEYQFGTTLPRGERGQLDLGGAKALPNGTITLIPPTRAISQPIERLEIDGVEIINMLTPGTEAPAEMVHYFPQHKVLDTGELALQTQHQLLTLRGAEIRDSQSWAKYLNEALQRFGQDAEVLVGQHTWPVFGKQRVNNYLSKQRDLYKWLHDQSLRLLNKGYKPVEIADYMRHNVPASLASEWFTQGYYGSVQRNAKAVYQQYMGWYDGNPANLDALNNAEYGRKFVAYAGGAEALLQRARTDYAAGEYRWVAQAMSYLVDAEPTNPLALELFADALEQLGYQTESAVERNAYLTGAMELRSGGKKVPSPLRTASPDTIHALSIENIFDLLGVRLNAPKAEGKRIVINWNFSDSGKQYQLNLENCALTYTAERIASNPDATLTLTRPTLDAIMAQQLSPKQAIESGELKIEGNAGAFASLLGLLDAFSPNFEIVVPNPPAQ